MRGGKGVQNGPTHKGKRPATESENQLDAENLVAYREEIVMGRRPPCKPNHTTQKRKWKGRHKKQKEPKILRHNWISVGKKKR